MLELENKKKYIYNGIINFFKVYDLFGALKMIVSDTTAVNTGKQNGVVAKLQQQFKKLWLEEPTFFGCQHHILEQALKHVLDQMFGSKSSGPEIEYNILIEVIDT